MTCSVERVEEVYEYSTVGSTCSCMHRYAHLRFNSDWKAEQVLRPPDWVGRIKLRLSIGGLEIRRERKMDALSMESYASRGNRTPRV